MTIALSPILWTLLELTVRVARAARALVRAPRVVMVALDELLGEKEDIVAITLGRIPRALADGGLNVYISSRGR